MCMRSHDNNFAHICDSIKCSEITSIKGEHVLPFLLDKQPNDVQNGVKPSEMFAAFMLSTEELLAKLRSPLRKYKIGSKGDGFVRSPEAIIFQNFESGHIYNATLSITNQRGSPQNLKLIFETSKYFSLSGNPDQNKLIKLNPGLPQYYKITFIPTNTQRDFFHIICFSSDVESFSVPIFALGTNPIVNIPDVIVLPPTVVKVPTEQTIVVKNTGNMDFNFSQVTEEPIFTSLVNGILPPNEIFEVTYRCYPIKTGHNKGKIKIYFRHDFCLLVDIECEVGYAQLNVVPQYLSFDDTYMGLTSKKILTLYNQSDFTLLFAWKLSDRKEEKERISKLKDLMEEMKNYEQTRCEKLEYMEIVDKEEHEKIYEKIFVDEANEFRHRKEFLYRSNFFDIIPKIGKVLPRTQFEFIVIFTPEKNIPYESSAFLDIAGVDKRIKTSFLGYGIGPLVELIVKDLDIGKIYLTDKHQYELVIANKGTVPATVKFRFKKCEWGGIINCTPESLKLEVNATKMFLVTFYSKVEGEFIETLNFKVEESEENLQCLFRGNVICPLLKCTPDILDFGLISAGVSSTMDLELSNESCVAIEYEFQLHNSGKCYSNNVKVIPSKGKVPDFSKLTIQVLLFSETSLKLKADLLLIMWNSQNHTKTIQLKATCSCPSITCNPNIINIKFCFINYLYTRTIKLQNSSASPGYVEFLEPKTLEDPIKCTLNQTKLYFEAHETKLIELKIIVSKLGSSQLNLHFSVTGGVVLNLCSVVCNGQGPVVSYHPDEVNFGIVEVLKKCEQKLIIANDSPIPATIQLYCKENTTFQISETPDEIELLPDEQHELTIWAELNTPGKHNDFIHLKVKNSDDSMIKISAEGKGTSILCEPPLVPLVNFGLLLTYKPFIHVVKLTNKGVLPYKLVFTKRSSIKSLKEVAEDDLTLNLFIIEPNSYEIHSGESQELTIKSVVKTPKTVSEEYFCFALIGKSPVIRTIFNFTLQAEFVDPQFSFSKREMDFDMHFLGDQSEGKLEDMVRVDNNTGIPLEIRFTVDDNEDNFTLIGGPSGWSSVEKKPSSTLSVKYTPNITEKRLKSQNARVIVEYQDHPKTDIINLHGVVMFPTIKLFPDKINFECVPCGSTCSQILIIQNVSAMMVKYEWLWLQDSLTITELEPQKENSELSPLIENKDNNTNFMAYIDNNRPMQVEQSRSYTVEESHNDRSTFFNENLSDTSFDKKTCLDEMRNIMSSVLSSHLPVKRNLLTIPNIKFDTSPISNIITLEPKKGILGPNEYTIITIGFNPHPETELRAAAICKVEGGEEEILEVTGKSSKLRYELDKQCVNFGNQVYCDLCSNYLTVNNTGRCTLNFKVSLEERVQMQADFMDVNPKCESIFPGEICPIKIDYLPGIPGIFNKWFLLELGYLKAVPINVRGYAVLNQAYLELPRPVTNLSTEDCYKAISWITPEYLDSVQRNGKVEIDDNPNDLRQFLEENNWVYISYNDLYPTEIDITMAMERMEAYNSISKSSKLLKESISNPQFFPSPYVIDFGYVVREVPVCYTVKLLNYGPLSIEIKLLEDNKKDLTDKELKIEFKPQSLSPNESMLFSVIFSPTTRRYPELNKKVETFIRLRIKRGPIITIRILAEVTLPVINILHEELHFDNVYCGDVLRKSIILSNDGNVTSNWTAVLLKPTRKRSVNFFTIPTNGQLEPGQKTYLDIYFMPADLHPVKQTLRIDVEWNSESLPLILYGEGLEAHLTVEPTKLNFEPTISYFETSLWFAVQNSAEIPMEFYFSSIDNDSEYEKNLVDIYLKHKKLKYVFGPLRQAGHPLPENFLNTYNHLVEKLREKMRSVQKVDDEVENLATEVRDDGSNDPLLKYSPKEVYTLLLEYVEAEGFDNDSMANTTMYHVEETSDNIEIIEPIIKPADEESERNGAVFIFHGAPNTDYLGGANQTGIVLSIPVYSIDRLIIEALIENSSSIATDIKDTIETTFSSISDVNAISLLESLENEDSEYDKLLEKINLILTTKPKKKDKKSPTKDKKSQGSSEKSSKGKDKNTSEQCFLDIQLDTFVDLLKPKMKALNNLIIESLHSTFIKNENQSLYMILKAAGSVKLINIVLFSYTIKDIIKNEENRLQAEKADAFQAKEVLFQEKTLESTDKRKTNQSASGKMSKTSADKKKGVDISKKVLQSLNKAFKSQLEEFDNLYQEIVHVGQYWDKKNQVLKKQFSPGTKKESSTKDSARTLKNSIKKGSSSLTLEDNSDCGLHMWIILNACNERGIDYRNIIANTFKADTEIQKILTDIEENKKPKFEEFDTTFTVVSKPNLHRNEPSRVFRIKNFQDVENVYPAKSRSKSGSSLKVRRRRGSKSSKKSVDSRSGVDAAISFAKADNNAEFSSKMVLEPGSQAKYIVTFAPQICGLYKYQYSLETTRSTKPFNITCKALCELPKIDMTPEFMFPKTLKSYKEKASYDHFVYIKDQRIFDFGSVIAGSTSLVLSYSSTILLRNISSTTCDVVLGLSSDLCDITPANIVIAPKSEDVVTISITPTTVGTFTCQMFISIKDNPKVETFTLAYSCSKLELTVSPKMVNFDKVPLYYTAKRIVRLTNSSPINLRWELSDVAWATEIFEIPEQCGFLELYSFADIAFKFYPTEELSLAKKYIQIKLYDVNCSSTEPCLVETVGFHADSVDYNLELLKHIEYGEVKGGVESKTTYSITNKGKHEVLIKIEIANNPLENVNYVREYFKIKPLELSIGAQKTENISIVLHPKSNFSLENFFLFVVSIVENFDTDQAVKSYKVYTSVTSIMPCYEICPPNRLSFGDVPLQNSKKLLIDITNNGRFSFGFTILNYAKVLEAQKRVKLGGKKDKKVGTDSVTTESKTTKKSGKKENSKATTSEISKPSKGNTTKESGSKTEKRKPIKITKIDVGGFVVTPAAGMVYPNENMIIEVEFAPGEVREYKEQILIKISEIEELEKNKILTFTATGCEPKIDLQSLEYIFMEQNIVTNIDNFVIPKHTDACCVFVLAEQTLYFKQICIYEQFSTSLHLKNIGSVIAHLTVKIEDFGRSVFTLSESNMLIEPYTEGIVQVTFRPNSLEIFNGTLQISTNSSTNNKLIVYLIGETCLPRIKLIEPLTDSNEASISFGPICVGCNAFKRFCVKNVGSIKAKLITELSDGSDQLRIVPADDYTWKKLLKEDVSIQNNLVLSLLAGDIASFDIWYKPFNEGSIESAIILHTISNPYETIKIKIDAFGYNTHIIMEGLTPLKLNRSIASDPGFINKNSIGYLLDLGYKQLNKLYKTSFLVKNRSTENIYKFRFYCSTMVFSPEVGHLKPGVTKEIIVIFKATQPVILENEEVTCYINKIEYVNPNDSQLSWDDRQKCVYWTTEGETTSNMTVPYSTITIQEEQQSSSEKHGNMGSDKKLVSLLSGSEVNKASVKTKVIVEGTEPDIITIPESFDVISVFLKVSADYTRYECNKNYIVFGDTFITEEKVEEFEIRNVGNVQLSITWIITHENEFNGIKKSNSDTKINLTRWDSEDISLKSVTTMSLISSSQSDKIESLLPFAIRPEKVDINPGISTKFTVSFSPKQVGSFKGLLTSNITSLDPSFDEIAIRITATALPTPLYFEMENGSICSKNVVLQFENIGAGTESTKHIYIVNPTVNVENFEIAPIDQREFSHFRCNKLTGEIIPNKKADISFDFYSPTYGRFKENYLLKIIENGVQKIIQLQGHCREPVVYFDENNIKLKPTVPQVKTSKTVKLKNEENFPVNFKFVKKTFFSENQQDKLDILPTAGRLESQSDCDIKITFSTVNAISTNFHVKCLVEKLKSPLNLLVSAAAVSVKVTVNFMRKNGEIVYLGEDRVNVIDAGPVIKGNKEKIQLQLTNQGKTGIFYGWKFDKKSSSLFKIFVTSENGFINSGKTASIDLVLEPLRKGTLKDFKISLNIMYGPTYTISLNAMVTNPNCKFSFERYNFGYCFVQKGETSIYNAILTFKNLENTKIFVENLFEKTNYLSLDYTSGFVSPGEVKNVKINFHPQVKGQYSSTVTFVVSGWKQDILVTGEGVDLKLDLCNSLDKLISFGDVLVNSTKKYRVPITNKSLAILNVRFDLYDNLLALQKTTSKLEDCSMQMPVLPPPPPQKPDKKNKGTKKNEKSQQIPTIEKSGRDRSVDNKNLTESQESNENKPKEDSHRKELLKYFSIVPNTFMDIPPKAKRYFDIVVQPQTKFSFNEKIYFETQNCLEPLCTIQGKSIAPDFSLDKTEVIFSGVITGCSSSQTIVIRNKGDVIGSFQWRFDDLKQENFSLNPKEGFVLPNEDVKINIVFTPTKVKCQIKTKVKCHFKEIDKPLKLQLSGNAVKIPEPASTIILSCPVRETVVDRSVLITNPTLQVWSVFVESWNKTFSTPEQLTVLPSNSVPLPITYCPNRMTGIKTDEGKIFIKYPDGGGMLYNVIGKATPPTLKKKIEKEIYCKRNYYEDLMIENWLSTKQIFNVETELLSPITVTMLYKILGVKTIELKGSEKKQYKWGVNVVNEGPIEFRVTFKNPDSGEYEFFEILYKVVASDAEEIIYFKGKVREQLTKFINLENPINVPVVYNLHGAEKYVTYSSYVTVEPYSMTKVIVKCCMKNPETIDTSITAKCEELGTYKFNLNIVAEHPLEEPCILFNCELGSKDVRTILFENTSDRVVDFTYVFEDERFYIEKCPSIPAGETSRIMIGFEPFSLEPAQSRLFLTSSVTGLYIYPLNGNVRMPSPKGPYHIKSTNPTALEFKNPFKEDQRFECALQPGIFSCDFNSNEAVKARKSVKLLISANFETEPRPNCCTTGHLSICATNEPKIEWKYYLQYDP